MFQRLIVLLTFFCLASLPASGQSDPSQSPPDPDQWDWRFVAGGATVGRGATDSRGTYYFAAEDRFLYALSPSGTMYWRTDLGRRPIGGVVIGPDGTVLVPLSNDTVLALNKDGRLLFQIEPDGAGLLDPLVLDTGVIVVATRSGYLAAYTHRGQRVWQSHPDTDITAAPIASASGRLFLGTDDGYLRSMTLQGDPLSQWYLADIPVTLADAGGSIVVGTESGRVIGVSQEDGALWRGETGSRISAVTISENRDFYVLSQDGSLTRMVEGGAIIWRAHPSPARVVSAISGKEVLASISGGEVTLLDPGGTTSWRLPVRESPGGPVVSSYGSLIVPTDLWVTYSFAIQIEESPVWPYARGDDRNRGVSPTGRVGRSPKGDYASSIEYLYLKDYLFSAFEEDQMDAIRQIAIQIEDQGDLSGSYHYLLELCEAVAGAPHFGPLSVEPATPVSRRAREQAIDILGVIGDLQSAELLARLLRHETDSSLQVVQLQALASLGTILDGELMERLRDMINRDSVIRPTDQLALATLNLIAAVHQYEGGFLTRTVADIITRITESNYNASTRAEALNTLKLLIGR